MDVQKSELTWGKLNSLVNNHSETINFLKEEKWLYHRALKHVCELHGENLLSILEHFATPTSERQKPAEAPASQELIDYVDRLEKGLINANEYLKNDALIAPLGYRLATIEQIDDALQSKPAKG